eukprot:TRINITY_DN1637_c0_g1_i1.p1 TRINITY_DN1637_c0_g1~~TRINITY_DN1637_c0_g1_i1.p1  ORF type:complete len:161 (+),score=5.85 TRINITY_DN1637_c0_g1_i1:92-574(+)
MMRRSAVQLSRSRQPKFLRHPLTEKQVDANLNMDRIYRNLALEKRLYRLPWSWDKDMRGAIIHCTYHSTKTPIQVVGTVLDLSHNETSLDAWLKLFFRKGKQIMYLTVPLMSPATEYRIVRERDDLRVWENFVKEHAHISVIYDHSRSKRLRKEKHALFW